MIHPATTRRSNRAHAKALRMQDTAVQQAWLALWLVAGLASATLVTAVLTLAH